MWERIEFLGKMTSNVVVGRVLEAITSTTATGKAPAAGSNMLFMLFFGVRNYGYCNSFFSWILFINNGY